MKNLKIQWWTLMLLVGIGFVALQCQTDAQPTEEHVHEHVAQDAMTTVHLSDQKVQQLAIKTQKCPNE